MYNNTWKKYFFLLSSFIEHIDKLALKFINNPQYFSPNIIERGVKEK